MKKVLCILLMLCFLVSIAPELAQAAESVNRYSVLVLDVSGSMRGTPMEAAKKAAIRFCEQVLLSKGNNKVAVISFTYSSYVACDFTENLQELEAAINSLYAYGGTSQYTALTAASKLFENTELEKDAIRNILLMSDGLPEGGTSSSGTHYTHEQYPYNYHYANAAYDVAVEMHKNYNIYTLGFFHSSEENDLVFGRRFMNDLQNKGYYEVTDPEELVFEFDSIADIITDEDTNGGKTITGTFRYASSFHKSQDSTTSYNYNDSFFGRNNLKYDPQLSTMSLCLAMSTFASKETNIWSDKAKNAEALLIDELGFNDFGQSDDWNQAPTMHSIGAVAAWKKVGNATLIALALRGGGYGSEWGGNFYMGDLGNHEGFVQAREKAVQFLNKYLHEHQDKISGRIKLWLVGYSRSAAVANLLAADLNVVNRVPSFVGLAHRDIYCYTFETPQGAIVDNASYGDHGNIHNVINKTDLVPFVAPRLWQFTHFNVANNHILPYIVTSDYQDKKSKMLKEYKEIIADASIGSDDKSQKKVPYKVLEDTRRIDIEFDTWTVDLFGQPIVKITIPSLEDREPYDLVLRRLVDELAYYIGTRSNYASKIQTDLTMTLDVFMGPERNEKIDLFFDHLVLQLLDNNFEGVRNVLAPFANVDLGLQAREAMALARLMEYSNRAAQAIGMQDPLSTLGELGKVLLKLLLNEDRTLLKLLDNAMLRDKPTTDRIFQPHYPEVTLAWLKAEEESSKTSPTPGTVRIIRINCPVDLRVYNSEGRIVASMIEGKVSIADISIGLGTNEQGEKVIHLPADAHYTVNITATDTGIVNYSVNEYSEARNSYTRIVSYFDVPIQKGDLLRGIVPQIGAAELMGTQSNGSSVVYQLLSSRGAVLLPNSVLSGDQIRYFEVSAENNNSGGAVFGGGLYLQDRFAALKAYPVSSGEFLGWYENDQLLSQEETYRFPVNSNRHIVGRFKPVTYHKVTFHAKEGGRVINVDGQYPAGTEVMIACEAEQGYIFSHWETYSGGTLNNAKVTSTSYIMPDNETVVTAVFTVDPATQPPLTGDKTPLGSFLMMIALTALGLSLTSRFLIKGRQRNKATKVQ